MIPSTITPTHIKLAAAEIRANGIPKGREADKFWALVDEEPFPPKYLLSVAAKYATGSELPSRAFSGGQEANTFLENLLFKVIPKNQDWTREECIQAVWAYDQMDLDRSLVKKHLYSKVAERIGRTLKAVEYKIQNVSACDPRPRAEKPINEAANKQHLLQQVFDEYWADRNTSRTKAQSARPAKQLIHSPWDLALRRIKSSMRSKTYMPIAVIAAIELIQEGKATPDAIPFQEFERRFDHLQVSLGEGAENMGWEPFFHLASTARVWSLWMGATPVKVHRNIRPTGRGQLIKLADRVSFEPELRPGLSDSSLIRKLKEFLGSVVQEPTADPEVLAAAVQALKGHSWTEPPVGNLSPKKVYGKSTSYVRDPKVVRWVLDRAKGTCELCGQPGPFLDFHGETFLEVHHVIHLANEGTDTSDNAVGLCPNCHRRMHHGADAMQMKEALLTKMRNIELKRG